MKSSSLLLGLAVGVGAGVAFGYWYWRRRGSSSGVLPLPGTPMKNKEEWTWERDEHGDICRVIIDRSVNPQ